MKWKMPKQGEICIFLEIFDLIVKFSSFVQALVKDFSLSTIFEDAAPTGNKEFCRKNSRKN